MYREAFYDHSHGRDRSAGCHCCGTTPANGSTDRRAADCAGGTLTVFLQPLYPGLLEGIPPGSSCIANAYTNNHDALAAKDISTSRWVFLHVVDTVAIVHAMILRMQALMLPVQTLVFGGH